MESLERVWPTAGAARGSDRDRHKGKQLEQSAKAVTGAPGSGGSGGL